MPTRRPVRRRALQIGIDTGGTFTDFVVRDGGDVRVHKVLSTPDDPSRAVLAGLTKLVPGPWDGEITYGSTPPHAWRRELGESERPGTSAVTPSVAPLRGRLFGPLPRGLPRRRLRAMQSTGGAVARAPAAGGPVRTILSGPAGGVVGAAAL